MCRNQAGGRHSESACYIPGNAAVQLVVVPIFVLRDRENILVVRTNTPVSSPLCFYAPAAAASTLPQTPAAELK